MVDYHGLARRYLMPLGFLMRPLLNGGTLGGQVHMYKVGQVWTYKTREGDEGSTLTILHVEENVANHAAVVWVRLDGLRVVAPTAPGGIQTTVGRAPFSTRALDASVIELQAEIPAEPPDLKFYAQRRAAIEAFDEGAYETSVADAVRALQRIHDKPVGRPA